MSPRRRETLAGLPHLLRVLASLPSPDTVVTALLEGPLHGRGVRTLRLWAVDGGDLVAVAGRGHTTEEDARYAILPGALDLAIWHAVRTGQPVIAPGIEHRTTAFGTIDEEFWAGVLQRTSAVAVVRAPLTVGPAGVGALGMIVDRAWPDDAADLLAAIGAALGLWLTNPASGCAAAVAATRARAGEAHLTFTARQRRVLALVLDGWSTPAIALELGQSESTIKSDLAAAMRAVRSSDRVEAAQRARDLGLL